VTTRPENRLVRVLGWLLTPFVVWAASFLGGWLGALIGQTTGTLGGGIGWLVGGAVLAGGGALAGWIRLLRRRERRIELPETAAPVPPATGRSNESA
jgi:hypothetical protein